MCDIMQTLLASIIGGLVVEFIHCAWADYFREYKQIKEDILHSLVFYAHFYSNPIDAKTSNRNMFKEYCEAGSKIRDLASRLRAFADVLGWFTLGIPERDKLKEASSLLIGLSNSFFVSYDCPGESHSLGRENHDYAKKIRKCLM